MLRLYHVLLGVILLAVLTPLGFVKYALPYLSSNNSSNNKLQLTQAQANTAQKQTQTTSSNLQPNEGNIWKNILGKTAVPPGWRVAACDGNTPLLCVSSDKKILGTVEMGVYPLENLPNFQQMLNKAGISPNFNVNYQSPSYQTQLASALKLWVADHYGVLEKDRRNVYGDSIVFSAQSPQQAPVGKLQGMRYGFSGIKRKGGLQEQHLGYVAFDGKALYVITTAFDPASETGKFDQLENFQRFEPFLFITVQGMNLPR
ncbi:hypothetical protein BZZ01_20475 [Nostocales cyanobacterium HT-58-2]|nr:hypothetical protein BZZ01_20475 [Nostocales cyanobacterium HT-58-2]